MPSLVVAVVSPKVRVARNSAAVPCCENAGSVANLAPAVPGAASPTFASRPVLLPFMNDLGGDPALSPARSPLPAAPVFLLHGTDDNVVPAIESTLLARDLEKAKHSVHVLLTPLITHAEVDRTSSVQAVWSLIDFWARLLDE